MSENLKEKLVEKIHKEQQEYFEELEKQPANKIIEASYETCYRSEIACLLETTDIDDEDDVATLLAMPDTLGELYAEWLSADCSVCDMLLDIIFDHIREVKNNAC